VFTNQDLVGRGGTTQPDPSAGTATGKGGTVNVIGPPPPEAAPDSDGLPDDLDAPRGGRPDPTRSAEHWRARAQERRTAISDAERTIVTIEERIAQLQNDLSPTNLADPNREQTRQAEIAKAREELEAARVALAEAQKALADLEEEARRLSIPPGWLR
jgi:hypothetical protein